MKFITSVFYSFLIFLAATGAAFSQTTGSVAGTVVDANGAIVVGATVTAVAADGKQKDVVTNREANIRSPGWLRENTRLKRSLRLLGFTKTPKSRSPAASGMSSR